MAFNSLNKRSSITKGQLEPLMRFKRTNSTVIQETPTDIVREIPICKLVAYEDGGTFDGELIANLVADGSWGVDEIALVVSATDMKLCGIYRRISLTQVERSYFDMTTGMLVSVYGGIAFKNTVWQLTSGSIIGTDNLIFTQYNYNRKYQTLTNINTTPTELTTLRAVVPTDNAFARVEYVIIGQAVGVSPINLYAQIISNGTGVSGYLIGEVSNAESGNATQDNDPVGTSYAWNTERIITVAGSPQRFIWRLYLDIDGIDGTAPYVGLQLRTGSGSCNVYVTREVKVYDIIGL